MPCSPESQTSTHLCNLSVSATRLCRGMPLATCWIFSTTTDSKSRALAVYLFSLDLVLSLEASGIGPWPLGHLIPAGHWMHSRAINLKSMILPWSCHWSCHSAKHASLCNIFPGFHSSNHSAHSLKSQKFMHSAMGRILFSTFLKLWTLPCWWRRES
jgi:hypothetical protein